MKTALDVHIRNLESGEESEKYIEVGFHWSEAVKKAIQGLLGNGAVSFSRSLEELTIELDKGGFECLATVTFPAAERSARVKVQLAQPVPEPPEWEEFMVDIPPVRGEHVGNPFPRIPQEVGQEFVRWFWECRRFQIPVGKYEKLRNETVKNLIKLV